MNAPLGGGAKEVGDLLVAQGKLTPQQLDQVRRRQRRLNLPQHRAIVDLNFASEEDTWRALAAAHHLEFVDPSTLDLKRETLDLVPIKFIFHYHLLPVGAEGDSITLAFSEPPRQVEAALRLVMGKRFRSVLATPSSIHAVIKKHFGLGAETVQKLREERGGGDINQEIVFDVQGKETDSALESTVSAFVDQILQEALRLRATDIHLEPYTNSIRLRYRVDGILEAVPVPADMRYLHSAVVSRLKIMAGLNIAEKRLPHDGRIAMNTGDEEYDLRVSIVPTKYGEAVCLRILGRQSLFLDLSQLGMEPNQEAIFSQLTRLPQGLVLLTGPTGSGKTTTLYTALAQANDESRKIITFEDPIEYQLEGTVQIQVRDNIGLTFAAGLRSVLRHDPDVVLVGEIRDFETAEIAVRAAQTGHLVLLHPSHQRQPQRRHPAASKCASSLTSSPLRWCAASPNASRAASAAIAPKRTSPSRRACEPKWPPPWPSPPNRSRPGKAGAASSATKRAIGAGSPSTSSSCSTRRFPTSSGPVCAPPNSGIPPGASAGDRSVRPPGPRSSTGSSPSPNRSVGPGSSILESWPTRPRPRRPEEAASMAHPTGETNPWLMLPFGLLLGAIALGPLISPAAWARHYARIALGLGAITVGYYVLGLHDLPRVVRTTLDYTGFIFLIGALYVVCGGIHLQTPGQAWKIGLTPINSQE